MKRVLITGAAGRLGSTLADFLQGKFDIIAADKKQLDITVADSITNMLREAHPDFVINAAAVTDVDYCEDNPKLAYDVNSVGPGLLAEACAKFETHLIHFSTNYVFDGKKAGLYTEEDQPSPLNIYGKSKLEGEKRVEQKSPIWTILRVAWLYGAKGNDFLKTVIMQGRGYQKKQTAGQSATPIKVVADQKGNPTWVKEVARQVSVVLENQLRGLYHCVAGGAVTRYELAGKVFEMKNIKAAYVPCKSQEFGWKAVRPLNAGLENKKLQQLGLNIMKNYDHALEEYLASDGRDL